jgi:hypothetical protein
MNQSIVAALFAAFLAAALPTHDRTVTVALDDTARVCTCPASYSSPTPNQLAGCGNGPLIVPSSPSATAGECETTETGCAKRDKANCAGSVNVQVTFPSTGNTCLTVWVAGGAAYPNPTQINSTSQMATLKAESSCNMTDAPSKTVSFYVWKQQPSLNPDGTLQLHANGTPVTPPDASYTFALNCGGCTSVGSDG